MDNVVGIFLDRKKAELAMDHLRQDGFEAEKLILLTPDASTEKLSRTPSEDAEQPGMGKALGIVAGGAAGLAGGAAISSLILPGVGPILAVGLAAGAFGIGGAVAGGAAGDFLETALTHGLPKDEIFLYEDALRQGRSVIIAFAKDSDRIERGRIIMEQDGAESLDAARKNWRIGLSDAEQAEYEPDGGLSADSEQIYRRGFEAALEPRCRGKSLEETRDFLPERYRGLCDREAFRRGYERGQIYNATLDRPRDRENA
jgi:hypothetical protein